MNVRTMRMSAGLSARQFEGQEELGTLLPRQPRLVPELVMVPLSRTSVAVYGGGLPRTLTCRQGLHSLNDILSRLDGSRTLDELVAEIDSPIDGGVLGTVALLFRYGFLEDGQGLAPTNASDAVESYCGRFFDTTRFHRNRTEILKKIEHCTLAVLCDPSLGETLKPSLDGVPIGSVLVVDPALPPAGKMTYGLVILTGGASDAALLASAEALHRNGVRYFMVSVGQDVAHIGPLVIPGITASHICASAQIDRPAGQANPLKAAFWAIYGLHEALSVILDLSAESYLNKVILHATDGLGKFANPLKIARVPGGPLSGMEDRAPLAIHQPAFRAWVHHVGVRMPPQEYLPPRSHQRHFTAANLALHDSPVSEMEVQAGIDLPSPAPLPGALPWLEPNSPQQEGPATLTHLSALLMNAAGYQNMGDGLERRIAPSGGQLTSCSLYVHVAHCEGLAPGLYAYEGKAHRVIPVPVDRPHALSVMLATDGVTPPLSIFITAHLDRVRGKYGDFGYNVAHLDCGVAIAYLSITARALGITLRHDPHCNTAMLSPALKLTTHENAQVACAALHLVPALRRPDPLLLVSDTADGMAEIDAVAMPEIRQVANPLEPVPARHDLLRQKSAGMELGKMLLARRAAYAYADRPIEGDVLKGLVALAQDLLARRGSDGHRPLNIRPWLVVPEPSMGLAAGIYDCGQGAHAWINRCSAFSRTDMAQCINQATFHKAGALLVMTGDLEAILGTLGPTGYRAALHQSGAIVAEIWMAAFCAGLVGTAAGGIIEPGLMRLANMDGYRESALFTLVLANPALDEAAHHA